MGEVFLAEDTRLDRLVAVKILPAEFAQNPDRMGRFLREAKAASALNHPHIAHIYEVGENEGLNFIAMEYVEGVTLRDKIHREHAPIRTLLKFLGQVADGLAKAHAVGVVHRDLKPDNIIISSDGYAKILDFGLAKHVEPSTSGDEFNSDTKTVAMHADLSTPGTIMGTAGYMSPEQARGSARVDQRSDIFAFGCLLYESASGGRQAFPGDTAVDSMYKILHNQPTPVTEYNPNASADLQRVIRRCLQKDPEDRYQTIKDVAIEIREILEELKVGAGSSLPPNRDPAANKARKTVADHGKWTADGAVTSPSDPAIPKGRGTQEHRAPGKSVSKVLAVVLTIAGFLGVGGLTFGIYKFARWGTPQSESGLRTTPLTSSPTVERNPALSFDGKQIAYVWAGDRGDNSDIYVKITDAGSSVRVTSNPAREMSPAWSPDGRFVAYLRGDGPDKGFYVVPALGGAERKIADSIGWSGASVRAQAVDWSPDGKTLAIIDRSTETEPWSIYLVSVATGEKRRLTTPPADHDGDTLVAFSPDGASLALLRRRDASTSDVFVVPVPGGEPSKVTADGVAIRGIDWVDNEHIVFSSERGGGNSTLWMVAMQSGNPTPVAGTGENLAEITAAPAGGRLAYAQISTDINLWRVANHQGSTRPETGPLVSQRFNASNRSEIDPDYSPSGEKVVFSSNRTGGSEIWVCDREGLNAVQLTNFGSSAVTGSPRFSPDGRTIAFDSRVQGNADIYLVAAEGGNLKRLTTDASEEVVPSWSADGRFVYYASRTSGALEIWKSAVEGGGPIQVTKNGGFVGSESTDGRFFYFTKGGAASGLWVLDLENGTEEKILDASVGRNWTLSGKGIYYLLAPSADGEPYTLLQFDPISRRISRPAAIQGSARTTPINVLAASPDARWLVYAQRDQLDYDVMLVENFR
jgi:serine/threonine protein kinase/Tol biopolymer transport system component